MLLCLKFETTFPSYVHIRNNVWYLRKEDSTIIPFPKSFNRYLNREKYIPNFEQIFSNMHPEIEKYILDITDSFSFVDYTKIVSLAEFFRDYFQFLVILNLEKGVVDDEGSVGDKIPVNILKDNYLSYIFEGFPQHTTQTPQLFSSV